VSSLLLKSVSVLASILIARWLGPFLLGEWTLVTYVTGLVYLFIELGTGTAAVRLIATYKTTEPNRARQVARTYVALELLLASTVLAVFVILVPWLSQGVYGDADLLPLFWIASATMFISTIGACFGAILQAYERIRLLAKLSLVFGIVHSGLLVGFVYLWGLMGGFVASLLANALQFAVYMAVLSPGDRRLRVLDRASVRELLYYALPTFATSAFLIVFNWIGATSLSAEHGFDSLGTYTVAQRVAFLVMYIPTAVVVPFFPMVADLFKRDPDGFRRTFNHTLRYVLFIVFPIVLTVAAFSRPLISVLYTDAYGGAAPIIPITAAAALLSAFLSPAGVVYYATGAMRRQFLLSATVFGVSVVVLRLLVHSLGAQGFAWALLAYYACSAALGPVLLRRRYDDPAYGSMTLVTLGLSSVVLLSGLALYEEDVVNASVIGAVLVTASVATAFLKVMTPRDRAFLASVARGFRFAWNHRDREH
jgi:O-antigen/teichoic acid export membrane protein